jgi:hypothetical protein
MKHLAILHQLKAMHAELPRPQRIRIEFENGEAIDPRLGKPPPASPPGSDLADQHRAIVGRKR